LKRILDSPYVKHEVESDFPYQTQPLKKINW